VRNSLNIIWHIWWLTCGWKFVKFTVCVISKLPQRLFCYMTCRCHATSDFPQRFSSTLRHLSSGCASTSYSGIVNRQPRHAVLTPVLLTLSRSLIQPFLLLPEYLIVARVFDIFWTNFLLMSGFFSNSFCDDVLTEMLLCLQCLGTVANRHTLVTGRHLPCKILLSHHFLKV